MTFLAVFDHEVKISPVKHCLNRGFIKPLVPIPYGYYSIHCRPYSWWCSSDNKEFISIFKIAKIVDVLQNSWRRERVVKIKRGDCWRWSSVEISGITVTYPVYDRLSVFGNEEQIAVKVIILHSSYVAWGCVCALVKGSNLAVDWLHD